MKGSATHSRDHVLYKLSEDTKKELLNAVTNCEYLKRHLHIYCLPLTPAACLCQKHLIESYLGHGATFEN